MSPRGELLRLATAGSVDDGKSTLIGRLLFDSKLLLDDQIASIAMGADSQAALQLALLTDGLRAERELGITIDVAYRFFSTERRRFILADTPGHLGYTRNMVTGASTADLAILLVDVRHGMTRQTRRHALIASLLGVPHLVVCVNKMDLVDYAQTAFEEVTEAFSAFAPRLAISDITFIPISALHGDNVVDRSQWMPWYQGPPLLYHLEHVHIASGRNLVDVRFPVQSVVAPISRSAPQLYAGQVASGVLRPGDDVVALPFGDETRIRAILTANGTLDEAFPPLSVTLELEDTIAACRGDMLARPHNVPAVADRIDAMVCWLGDEPLRTGERYIVKHTAHVTEAVVEAVRYRMDVETLHRDVERRWLGPNDVGRVRLATAEPLIIDPYARNRVTGAFILIDRETNGTAGAGLIQRAAR